MDNIYGASDEAKALFALYRRVEAYYSRKVVQYGPTSGGADWSSCAAQQLRFTQLLKICDFSEPFSLNDLGCGYGGLLVHIAGRHLGAEVDYLGIDLSAAMIWHARRLPQCRDPQQFVVGHHIPRAADYTVASGIFNVRLTEPIGLWRQFIRSTLTQISAASRKGFAVNFMCRVEPGCQAKRGLYLARPETWIDYCERTYRASAEVLSGYGLAEFTLLVHHRPQRQAD